MSSRSLGLIVGIACAVAVAACSSKPKGPGRDVLVAQLQQEAEALKAANENQDTSLGVSTIWTIASVDVVDQPDNEAAPWVGTILFKIKAETKDGSTIQEDEYDKVFAYTFNPTIQKWVFDYKP